jgi:antagonist of KipI
MPVITVVNPGFFTIVVDAGRQGLGALGIPTSSALDLYAYRALQYLVGGGNGPALEAIGRKMTLKFDSEMGCAITGARVSADVDGEPVRGWSTFRVGKGGVLRIRDVVEGLRYYIGFSGIMEADYVAGSYATNVECLFGGFKGRALKAGDRLAFSEMWDVPVKTIPDGLIPSLKGPHEIRVVPGPEEDFFRPSSVDRFWGETDRITYRISPASNRAGVRLEGEPLLFREGSPGSIISEGIFPGTVQIPGDGLPLIVLCERTIGGYARAGIVARADRDLLAHLEPGKTVTFKKIGLDQAKTLWHEKCTMTGQFS